MAVVATITDQLNNGPRLEVEGTLVFSGSYVANGEVPTFPGLKTSKSTPVRMNINSIPGLYDFSYDPLTGKIVLGLAGVATTPGAYPAPLTAGITYFSATFRKP